jgi:phage gp36-like protein
MTVSLISTPYTSDAELVSLMGQEWLISNADHDGDGAADPDAINRAINAATQEIDLYLGQRYESSVLATHDLVRDWATVRAAMKLHRTAGDPLPQVLIDEWAEILATLKALGAGQMTIPGLSTLGNLRPTMSTRRIDRRYGQRTVRVERDNSTEVPTKLRREFTGDSPGSGTAVFW